MDQLSIRVRGRECANLLSACLAAAFKKTLALETTLPSSVLDMAGSSGAGYRILINNLVAALPSPRYLEIGSWPGSTASAAMSGNVVDVLCMDDWSAPGSSAEILAANLARVKAAYNDYDVWPFDFRAVDYTAIGAFNIFLFAGPHDQLGQTEGLAMPVACLDEEFILVAEEWNDAIVRSATGDAIRRSALTCLYGFEIRTTQDDTPAQVDGHGSEWHNGYFVGAFVKGPR